MKLKLNSKYIKIDERFGDYEFEIYICDIDDEFRWLYQDWNLDNDYYHLKVCLLREENGNRREYITEDDFKYCFSSYNELLEKEKYLHTTSNTTIFLLGEFNYNNEDMVMIEENKVRNIITKKHFLKNYCKY